MIWSGNNHIVTRFLILSASLLHFAMHGQTPQFKTLEVTTKSSGIKILHLDQDSSGYLWLGTSGGILRYDGIAYQKMSLPDSLRQYRTTAIFIDEDDIYAGFENGCLAIINKTDNNKIVIRQLSAFAISDVLLDENNSLWIGTEGGGILNINASGTKTYTTENGLADNYVHCLALLNHQLAVGTDLGLSMSNLSEDGFSCRNYDTSGGLSDNLILTMAVHDDENLILGMQNGSICNFNSVSHRIDAFSTFNGLVTAPILKVLLLQNDILIITETSGAFIINWADRFQVQQFLLTEEDASQRVPFDCIVDQEGNLLVTFGDNNIVTANFGLQFIRNHDGETFAGAHCLLSDREGNIWFANDHGIFKHQGEFSNQQLLEQYYVAPAGQNNIISLCEGTDNEIWFGTFGNGLGRIDKATKSTRIFTEKDGLINNNILSICMHNETFWLATLGGACELDYKQNKPSFKNFDISNGLASNFIYCVFSDSKNQLWLGTDGKGLAQYKNTSFIFLNDRFPEAGKSIVEIAEDKNGNLWFYSTDKGLQWTDQNSLYSISLATSDEKVEIFAIHDDPFGNIIALTSGGIATINTQSSSVTFVKTGFNIEVNYLNIITRDIKGRIWIGTDNAMIRFSQFNIGMKILPKTIIQSVDVMLLPIDTLKHEFEYNQNHFTFNLSSIWLQDPESIIYQYKLTGYDVDWVTTRDRKVIFSKLSPGKYNFQLRSSSNNEWDTAIIVSYQFEILEPFWKQIWFILLIMTAIVLVIWGLIRIRINALRRNESLATQKAQSQFDTLKNQVNPHFLFNSFNTLNSIIAQDRDAAIGYVDKLSDYYRIVLEQRDKDIIQLKEEITLVNHYLFLQKQRFGDNMIVHIAVGSEHENSSIPPLTIQMLVENAIKHNVISKNKPLTIEIFTESNSIHIKNNIQSKLSMEPSTGIGLENIKQRYKILFNKTITVVNNGDNFIVVLPIASI